MWPLILVELALAGTTPPDAPSPEDWIAAVDARITQVAALRWAVRRSTEQGEARTDERWRFTWDGGERFRIDYFGDTARQVASDGEVLVDYVPAAAKALRFELDELPTEERTTVLAQVLGRVFVPGLRIGGTSGLEWRVVERVAVEGRDAVVLEGSRSGEPQLSYTIDTERLVLLRSEATHEGRPTLRTVSSAHREIDAGLWLPERVEIWSPEARVRLDLSRVEALDAASPALFQLTLDSSVSVEAHP